MKLCINRKDGGKLFIEASLEDGISLEKDKDNRIYVILIPKWGIVEVSCDEWERVEALVKDHCKIKEKGMR